MINKLTTAIGVAGAIAAGTVIAPSQAQAQDRTVERVLGTILNGVLNRGRSYDYGRYPNGNYGYNNQRGNERAAVDRCARAVESRISREYRDRRYRDNRYDRYDPYHRNDRYNRNYRSYSHGARVTGIQDVRRTRRGLKVYGVASTGYNDYGSRSRAVSDLRWSCDIDYNGRIRDTDVDRISRNRTRNPYRRY